MKKKLLVFLFLSFALSVCAKAQAPGGVGAIYEYFNAGAQKHFYTNDYNELGAGTGGWQYQKIAFYLAPSPRGNFVNPVYRYYSPGKNDAHYYTTRYGVRPSTFTVYEGIIGYAASAPSNPNLNDAPIPVYELVKTSNGDYLYQRSDSGGQVNYAGYNTNGISFWVYKLGIIPQP